MRRALAWLVLIAAPAMAARIDTVSGAEPWQAMASDDVAVTLDVQDGGTLALAWDYRGHNGYAGAMRRIPLDFPENFEITLPLQGDVTGNVLELKFVDASGDNVWWIRRPQLTLGPEGQVLHFKKREVSFAWGPTEDRRLTRAARLELVVTARSGHAGHLTVGPISLTPVPVPPAVPPLPTVTDDGTTHRLSPSAADAVPIAVAAPVVIDWGYPREVGGARLEWQGQRPVDYRLESSQDGQHWQPLQQVHGEGLIDWIAFATTEARYWRLTPAEGESGALLALAPQPPGFGDDPNARIAAIARERPRGEYPRGVLEQTAWTVVGTPGHGDASGLLSEDGAYEWGVGAPSIEPFLSVDGTRMTWADATATPALRESGLPLPSVRLAFGRVTLTVDALAPFAARAPAAVLTYRLHNTDAVAHAVDLDLAVRPLQVNPPAQFLNVSGGVSPIGALRWEGQVLAVTRPGGDDWLRPSVAPTAVAVGDFDGSLPGGLPTRTLASAHAQGIDSGLQLAQAVLRFHRDLPAGATVTVALCVGPHRADAGQALSRCDDVRRATFEHEARARWRERLGRVTFQAEAPLAQAVASAIRTAHAHLLQSADGVWLRPGTRSYARSWIRDGAMMSAALLRLGESEAPRAYLRAWAQIQYRSGKVPCCHDARGADPVPEHDSAGQFLFLAAQVLQFGGERGRRDVAAVWPQIVQAVAYLDSLRAQTLAAGQPPEYAGLLPVSISHEGYSAKPMHALWDDDWALRGYADARDIALALGHPTEAAAWAASRGEFSAAVRRSLALSMRTHAIDYLPGAADLGDFDPTSTTVALAPGTGGDDMPEAALRQTFERYWQFFRDRRDGTRAWDNYTPYEWRNVGALVRLGERERAVQAFEWFFAARRPPAWNQWTEVVTRDAVTPRFIGDLPHGWVASDFLRATLDLYAYEEPAHGRLVLGAGLPADWLQGRGVTVQHLRTPWGPLSYRARRTHGKILVSVHEYPAAPGGVVLDLPGVQPTAPAWVDGVRRSTDHGRLTLSGPAQHIQLVSD